MDFLKKLREGGSKNDSKRASDNYVDSAAEQVKQQQVATDALTSQKQQLSPTQAGAEEVEVTRKKRLITWPSEPEPALYLVDKNNKKIYSKGKQLGKVRLYVSMYYSYYYFFMNRV